MGTRLKNAVAKLTMVAVALFVLAGCGSSGSDPVDPITQKSFLQGGTEGRVIYRTLTGDVTTTLPYLGEPKFYAQNQKEMAEDQLFLVYGGSQSALSERYQVIGNSPVNERATLKYLLKVNDPDIVGETMGFKLDVKNSEDGNAYCIVKSDDGMLSLEDSNALICNSNPIISDGYMIDSVDQALEINIDLGAFTKTISSTGYEFKLSAVKGLRSIPLINENLIGNCSGLLNVNPTPSSNPPKNTIATGGFLPSPNGFGFVNASNNNPGSSLPNNSLAALYGPEAVCFNDSVDNCILNAYGYYMRETNVGSGGNCEGFSASAMFLYTGTPFVLNGKSKTSEFNPRATTTQELVQSDIWDMILFAYMAQMTPEYLNYVYNNLDFWTPNQVIDEIIAGFSNGDPIYTLGISESDGGGHSVLPYAITQESDEIRRIYIYDNNYPGSNEQYIEVNTTAESWKYCETDGCHYSGSGSGIYNEVMRPIPLSMQVNYTRIDTIENDTTQLTNWYLSTGVIEKMKITAPDGAISGWDFQANQEVNNIPGVKNTQYPHGIIQQYVIPDNNTLTTIPSPLDKAQIEKLISESYSVDMQNINPDTSDAYQVKFSQNAQTSLYSNGYTVEQYTALDRPLYFLAHPSARFFVTKNASKLDLTMFMDDNEKKIGYVYDIDLDYRITVPIPGASLAVFIDDNGNVQIYTYTVGNIEALKEGVDYTVTASIITLDGTRFATIDVHQEANSSVLISPVENNIPRSVPRDGLDLYLKKVF